MANKDFEERDTQVLGISNNARPAQTAFSVALGNIPYPILSDFYPHGEVAKLYGIFNEETGASRRAIFVVDKEGTIQFKRIFTSAADISIDEVLEAVDKLQ